MPEAIALVESAKLILDPWQKTILEVILSERSDGKWECREVAYLVSRQNGKGGVLEALALIGLFLLEDVHEILFSAHEFKTAKKAYRQIRDRIKATPHLLAQVERRGNRVVGFRQSNDDVSITLQDGTALRFMARSNNTGRGFSPQMLILDEAQECSEETRQALFNTLRAQANPLVVWCGTVPSAKNNSEAFSSLRLRGRRGGDPTLGWLEWTPEGSDDPDYEIPDWRVDEIFYELVAWSNPGLGYRITKETVDADRSAAVTDKAIEGLLRECLSIWPNDPEDNADGPWEVVDKATWNDGERAVTGEWFTGVRSVSLEVAIDFSTATLTVAGPVADDQVNEAEGIAVLVHAPGTSWVVERCREVHEATGRPIVIDKGSPADQFTGQLEAAGVEVELVDTPDVAKAAAELFIGIHAGRVLHRAGDDQAPLTVAASQVTQRLYGDIWLWDRRTGAVVLPWIGASLALWGSHQEVETVTVGYFSGRR